MLKSRFTLDRTSADCSPSCALSFTRVTPPPADSIDTVLWSVYVEKNEARPVDRFWKLDCSSNVGFRTVSMVAERRALTSNCESPSASTAFKLTPWDGSEVDCAAPLVSPPPALMAAEPAISRNLPPRMSLPACTVRTPSFSSVRPPSAESGTPIEGTTAPRSEISWPARMLRSPPPSAPTPCSNRSNAIVQAVGMKKEPGASGAPVRHSQSVNS